MRRRSSSSDEAADVNVTPLLDIVFIMLIFFIVTATFVFESGIEPNLPQASDEKPVGKTISPLVLSVLDDGFVQIDGGREVDPRSVKPVVEEYLAREAKGSVIISASPGSDTGTVTTVLDQARLAAGPERYDIISLAKQSGAN